MEKIMDKREHFTALKFYVICVVALIIILIASICGIVVKGRETRHIPDGTYYCPNCGMVMELYVQEV